MSALPLMLTVLVAAQQQQQQAPHWAAVLGARVLATERRASVVDRVVLVPDAATYLQEIARWTPQQRWPVLIEDRVLAPMFIRRFKPAQVLRRDPATPAGRIDAAAIERAATAAWSPTATSLRGALEERRHVPPGVVIASAADPAWTAALALAAARGEVLAWLDESFKTPDGVLAPAEYSALLRAVHQLVAGAGYPYAGLGDAIDTITLCRAVAGRAQIMPDEIRAVTDMLGRGPEAGGRRYAYAGWIFGDEARCAYTAMCALFLSRDRFWLYNTYREPQITEVYGVEQAAVILTAAGYTVRTADVPHTTRRDWLAVLAGGVATDVLIMNSGGEMFNFALADEKGYAGDIPILNEPLALDLAHSHSLRSPGNLDSIGGRWLARGVYAYAGAVDEPMLSAFVPPKLLVARCAGLVPFLIAARDWNEGPPWKVTTIGDPLMICPPQAPPRQPAAPDGGTDLRERVKETMRQAAAGQAEALTESLLLLDLLGEDGVAARLWQGWARTPTADAAKAALPALFRMRLAEPFLRAWEAEGTTHDPREVDMLWHLMGPRLDHAGEDALVALSESLRPIQAEDDLRRLRPHMISVLGVDQTRRIIQRQLDKTTDPGRRKRLQELLSRS